MKSTPTATEPATAAVPIKEITIIVNSLADSGPGILRQALPNAQSGDTITFDLDSFPLDVPATIFLTTVLPPITLKIDASNSRDILDGSNLSRGLGRWSGYSL